MKKLASKSVDNIQNRVTHELEQPAAHSEVGEQTYYQQRLHFRSLRRSGWTGIAEVDTPWWMVEGTTFHDNIWICNFGRDSESYRKVIKFDILLSNGSRLTDEVNTEVLAIFKHFIIMQNDTILDGSPEVGTFTAHDKVSKSLNFLDWIVLNDSIFNIGENGLSLITVDNIKDYLAKNVSTPVSTYLYEFPLRLSVWLKSVIGTVTDSDIHNAKKGWPNLDTLPASEDCILDMSEEEIIKARAYIYREKIFTKCTGVIRFNNRKFVSTAYINTLQGCCMCPVTPPELVIREDYYREYAAVPIRNKVLPGVTNVILNIHIEIIRALYRVDMYRAKIVMDLNGVNGLTVASVREYSPAKPGGRYRMLPFEVIYKAVRGAFEYQWDNLGKVLDSILSLVTEVAKVPSGKSLLEHIDKVLSTHSITQTMDVDCWTIAGSKNASVQIGYHQKLRESKGLYEVFTTLQGCCLLLIGVFSARRQAEILKLSINCVFPLSNPFLDINADLNYSLEFHAGKTGNFASKQLLRMPIPRFVAKILWLFKGFNQSLVKLGVIPKRSSLFVWMRRDSLKFLPHDARTHNRALDMACDFLELQTIRNADGVDLRFYIRQHQLRGFFAMAFYWSAGVYSLDALRGVLGHASAEQVFRYVTSITPGSMLQAVKAERICSSLASERSDLENLDALRSLLKQEHGIDSISLKEANKVVDDFTYHEERGLTNFNVDSLMSIRNSSLYDTIMVMLESHAIDLMPDFIEFTDKDNNVKTSIQLILKIFQRQK